MQKMTKPFICPECNQSFTGKDPRGFQTARFPLILNCAHSVCTSCIKSSAKQQKCLSCPKCKKVTNFNDGEASVESLPPDLHVVGTLSNLNRTIPRNFKVKFIPAGSSAPKECPSSNFLANCENCLGNAKWRCDNCTANLCIKCFDKIHKSNKLFKKHHGRPIVEQSYRRTVQAGCQDHEQKAIEFYCEDDGELACSLCAVTGKHSGHRLVTLFKKNEGCITEVSKAVDEAKKMKARLKSTEKKIAALLPNSKLNTTNYEQDIRDYFHQLHCCLQIRENELLNDLSAIAAKSASPLENMHHQTLENIKEVSALLEDATTVICNSFVTINAVELTTKLQQSLDLPCHLVPTGNTSDSEINLHLNEKFVETFQNIGKIESNVLLGYVLLPEKELPPDYQVEAIDNESTTTDGESSSVNGSFVGDLQEQISLGIVSPNTDPLPKIILRPKNVKSVSHELVCVSHIKNPNEFWVQRENDLHNLKTLENDINKWCRKEGNKKFTPSQLELGSLYLVQYGNDQNWYRARLKKIIGEPCTSSSSSDTLSIEPNPSPMETSVNFHKIDCDPIAVKLLFNSTKSSIELNPMEPPLVSGKTIDLKVTNDDKLEAVRALSFEEDVFSKNPASGDAGPLLMEESSATDDASAIVEDGSASNGASQRSEGSAVQNNVMETSRESFETLNTSVSSSSENEKSWADAVEENEARELKQKDNQGAIDSTVSTFRVIVHYVDYGNTETVSISRMRMIQTQFLKLPCLALQCCLWEIEPQPQADWSLESVKMFAKLVGNYQALMRIVDERNNVLYIDLCKPASCDIENDCPVSVREALVFLEMAQFPNPQASLLKNTRVRRPGRQQTFFPPEQLHNELKANVVVSHVNSPSNFYVQQLGAGARYLSDTIFELQDYYGTENRHQLLAVFVPTIGMACVAQFSLDKHWYRAQVIGLLGAGMVKVFYVDFGNTEVVPCWQLAKAADKFMKLPAQAVHCTLSDVVSVDGSGWTDEAIAWFKDATKKEVISMIVHDCMPKEKAVISLFEVTDEAVRCISGLLVVEGYARSTGTRSKFTEEKRPEAPLEVNREPRPFMSEGCLKEPGVKVKKKHNYTPITVSYCEDPGCIYIHISGKDKKQLESLMSQMKEAYEKMQPSQREWAEGDVCVVLNPKDQLWYRGRVMSTEEDCVHVFFLDYGMTEKVSFLDLRVLEEEFLKEDIFAIRCHLTGVLPAGDTKKWSRLACEFFKEQLCCDKALYVKRKGARENESQAVDLFVKKISQGTAVDPSSIIYCSITEMLLDEGLAIPTQRSGKKVVADDDTVERQAVPSTSSSMAVPFISLIPADASLTWLSPITLEEMEMDIMPTHVGYDGFIYFHPYGKMDNLLRMISDSLVGIFNSNEANAIGLIREGQICVAKFFLDKKWYRAEVTKVLQEYLEVFFVDYGNVERVSFNDIRTHVAFLDVPKLCHKALLYNATPVSENGQWSESTLNFIHVSTVDKICHMCIEKRGGNGQDMYVSLQLPGNISLLDVLEKKMMIHKPILPITIEELVRGSERPIPYEKLPSPPENSSFPVLVTQLFKTNVICMQILKVKDPTTIFEVIISKVHNDFLIMMEHLAASAASFRPVTRPKPGMACCGMYTFDDSWYRCLVLDVLDDDDKVSVYYVDYGNFEVLPLERLRQLPKLYLSCPMQGFICHLHGLKPNGEDWCEEAYPSMLHLLFDNVPSSGNFTAEVVASGPPAQVQLLMDTEKDKLKLVYESLLESGVICI